MRARIITLSAITLGCVTILVVWFELIWRPMFAWQHHPKFDSSYDTSDYGSSYYSGGGGYDDSYTDSSFNGITKRQPPDIQTAVKPLIAELRTKSYDDLIILKTAEDPCELSSLIDCHNIEPKTVKQYVEVAFSHRQFLETTDISRRYNYISFTSMIISLISLAVVIASNIFEHRRRLNQT